MVKELISKSEFARRAGVGPSAVTKAFRGILKDATDGKRIDVSHPSAVKYIQDKADAMPISTTQPATGIDPLYEAAIECCRVNGRYTASNIQRQCRIGYARSKKILATMRAAGIEETTPKPAAATALAPKPARVVRGNEAKHNTKKAEGLKTLNNDIEQGRTLHEIPDDIKAFAYMTLTELIQRFGTDIAFLDWLKATKAIEDINEKRLKNATTRGELVNRNLIKVGVIEPFDTTFKQLLSDGAKTIARRVCAMNGAGRSVTDCEVFVADQMSSFIKPAKAKIARTLKNA